MGSSIVIVHAHSGLRGPLPFEKEVHDVDGADVVVIDDTTESAVGVIVHFRVERGVLVIVHSSALPPPRGWERGLGGARQKSRRKIPINTKQPPRTTRFFITT